MIIPVRCFSCGKPIGHLWEEYLEKIQKKPKVEVLDELGLTRYCCRRMLLGHIDLYPEIVVYD
ncbi:MAG: DNA-directed RNA polymerase subunit N [archaeon]